MNIADKILSRKSVWEKIQEETKPVVLYGTGNGADVVLDKFAELNITVSAVCASDGFVRKRSFRGYDVISISKAEELFGDFTICLGFATSIAEVMARIINLSQSHKLLVPVVPVFGTDIIDREFIGKNKNKINTAHSLLYDDTSKAVYEDILTFEFTGELDYLLKARSNRKDALTELLKLNGNEHYVDLGAYRGDTLTELIEICGGYEKAYAFEPDTKTFLKLKENTKEYKNLTLYPYAAWEDDTTLTFSGGGGRQSALSDTGYQVQAKALDSLLADKTVTYIKADVEGAEKEALRGMSRILTEQKPKLCISAYHRSADVFNLIMQIHEINPDYKIHLCHHPYIPAWDTNIYCT